MSENMIEKELNCNCLPISVFHPLSTPDESLLIPWAARRVKRKSRLVPPVTMRKTSNLLRLDRFWEAAMW